MRMRKRERAISLRLGGGCTVQYWICARGKSLVIRFGDLNWFFFSFSFLGRVELQWVPR